MGLYGKSVIAFTKSNFLIQFWIEMLTSAHSTNLSEAKAFFSILAKLDKYGK